MDGYYDEDIGEDVFFLFYSRYSCFIPISQSGLFYCKFSCLKYDRVLELSECDIYITEKNGRYGLVDIYDNTILHTSYNDIRPYFYGVQQGYGEQYQSLLAKNVNSWKEEYKGSLFFIVRTETGKFLFNLSKRSDSQLYDDIFIMNDSHASEIIYKKNGKYGVLDIEGMELLKPFYEYDKLWNYLYYEYKDLKFKVSVKKNLIYGVIPADVFDICFLVGEKAFRINGHYYIVKKGDYFGLLSDKLHIISEPVLDEIILYKPPYRIFDHGCLRVDKLYYNGPKSAISYVIARKGPYYKLFNAQNGHLIIDNCDNMKYTELGRNYDSNDDIYDMVEYHKGSIIGYVLWNESIISTEDYDEIEVNRGYLMVRKKGKTGILLTNGRWLIKCIYDSIKLHSLHDFTVVINGETKRIHLEPEKGSYKFNSRNESLSYGRYGGSYAQDEMGYSDDDIDTIFDGDPSAYWNID